MNIQILSLPRSGKGCLVETLRQSPDISTYIGEPFNPDQIKKFSSDYNMGCGLQWKNILVASKNNNVLIKHIHHAYYLEPNLHFQIKKIFLSFEHLMEQSYFTIRLIRRDVFGQVLSACVAEKTAKWHYLKGDKGYELYIDPQYFKNRLWFYQLGHRVLLQIPFKGVTLYYEDFAENNENIWNLVPQVRRPTHYSCVEVVKSPDKQRHITNYDELWEIYQKLDWARYLRYSAVAQEIPIIDPHTYSHYDLRFL